MAMDIYWLKLGDFSWNFFDSWWLLIFSRERGSINFFKRERGEHRLEL
jgi:hypothetical protein